MAQSETELALDLGGETIRCSADEVAAALAGLLREMRAAAPFVTPEEREALRLIMLHPGGALTVGDLFPDFERDSDALTALRRLRTAQFIRPADRDRWEAGERIEVKPLARLLWDKLGEAAIFGDAPDGADEPDVSEDIDLSQPGVDDAAATVRVANKGATAWDEADVLDFLNSDPKLER